jgi:sensor domain CHASE-containing protein
LISYYYVFFNCSKEIESRFARDNIQRINNSLDIEINDFAFACSRLANDIKKSDFDYSPVLIHTKDDLNKSELNALGFSFVGVTDLNKNIIYSDSYEYPLGTNPKELISRILDNNTIKEAFKYKEEIKGIIKIKQEIYIISMNSIEKKENNLNIGDGYFIAGKNIKNSNIFDVSYEPDHLNYLLFTEDYDYPGFDEIRSEAILKDIAIISDKESKGIYAYRLVRDISNQPVILLTLYQHTDIFDIGKKAAIIIIYISLIVVFILISLFILVFEKIVISKITKLNDNVSMVLAKDKCSNNPDAKRISYHKTDDEIDNLNNNIQDMLRLINYRYSTEKLSKEIMNDFLNCKRDAKNLTIFLNNSLERIGSFVGADRAFIGVISKDKKTATKIYEWDASGIESTIDKCIKYPIKKIKWIIDILEKEGVFIMKSNDELFEKQLAVFKLFDNLSVKSNIIVSIYDDNKKLAGFIGINTAIEEKIWNDEDISLLKNIAIIFSKAIS